MIIEIPGCKFRIKGDGLDWQVQYPAKARKDGRGDGYAGKYFFPSLEFAVAKAYELALKENEAVVDFADVPAECERVKKLLIKAVKAAMK